MNRLTVLSSREESAAPSESPRAEHRRGLSLVPYTCAEDEDVGRPLPREYDANGHYALGPKLKQPALVKLIGQRVEFAPAREKAPAATRRQMGREATRAAREARSQKARQRSLAALAPILRAA